MQLFTGKINASNRRKIWQTADIIFSTPQCIANDLKKNLYSLDEVSLLIEDECHRCLKSWRRSNCKTHLPSQRRCIPKMGGYCGNE